MSWSKNNIAHTSLWALVTFMHQNTLRNSPFVSFAEGGEWDMDIVTKTAAGSPNQLRLDNAEAVATQLDQFFVGIYKTTYEKMSEAVTKQQAKSDAIAALKTIFANQNEKLKTAGDIVDEHYLFRGEVA